ncbi:MAG TPA: hypothetical protein C5S51_07415 [Methanosarcinaceae archaeon]|nr:hypothetical protein [Methanosarcinaceae archaeon]
MLLLYYFWHIQISTGICVSPTSLNLKRLFAVSCESLLIRGGYFQVFSSAAIAGMIAIHISNIVLQAVHLFQILYCFSFSFTSFSFLSVTFGTTVSTTLLIPGLFPVIEGKI